MTSIRNKLVRTLSFTITGVMLIILLAIDIAVDSWIDNQFNRELKAKAGMLMTLTTIDNQEIKFNFSSQFLPEFDGSIEPEYFQFWLNNSIFQRSKSLDLFTTVTLPYNEIKLGQSLIVETTLPDGRAGRILYQRFLPQSSTQALSTTEHDNNQHNSQSLLLAYATSAESINFVLWLIDIVFIVTTISVIIFIRLFVRKAVENGLAPLKKLNEQINSLSLTSQNQLIKLDEPVYELIAIKTSLNRFIHENRALYLREKRLTSDIAHELRTPIAELINISEVVQKFPEKAEKLNYAPEVMNISKRLNNIVVNILLLHKHQNSKLDKNDVFDINQVISRVLNRLAPHNIYFEPEDTLPAIVSNLSAVESILTNLFGNALTHRLPNSPILISIQMIAHHLLKLDITNTCVSVLNHGDLNHLFEPLWQKDAARSANENYGLGLTIAAAFANAIDIKIETRLHNEQITFSLLIPISTSD